MKKILILLTTLLLTQTVFGQVDSTSTESTEILEAERIVDKYGSKIVESFNRLVESITPYAEEGFSMVVKLQVAKGVTFLLPLVGFILCMYLSSKEATRIRNILDSNNVPSRMDIHASIFYKDNATVQLILFTILACVLGIIAIFSTVSGILHIVAPEWYAVHEIIELVKTSK